jgi:uncharacterized phiE125 gp8 family phage protein
MMTLTLLTGPAVEPLELDDVKAHLRLDGADEDGLLSGLISTSRMHVEAALGLALISQTWRWQADCWPSTGVVELMTRPLQSVTQIAVRAEDGTPAIVDAADYVVHRASGRVAPRGNGWPEPGLRMAGIEIEFVAGYGNDGADVPEPIRQALRLLVAHWYEVRNPVHIGAMATRVPDTVSELLMPYKARRI